jgi:hypothetical protein
LGQKRASGKCAGLLKVWSHNRGHGIVIAGSAEFFTGEFCLLAMIDKIANGDGSR